MVFILLFVVMFVYFYCVFNIVPNLGIALAMGVIGCLVPTGIVAAALNFAWYLYKRHNGKPNPLSS